MYATHSYTDTLIHINTCSDAHSENSNYRAWGGHERQSNAGEQGAKLCVIPRDWNDHYS